LLALKLLLVPAGLALLSLAARAWGPRVGGWLAGMPIVAGPILFFMALENGEAFGAQAASAALGAAFATVWFCLAYAWTATRHGWRLAALAGIGAWTAGVLLMSLFQGSLLAGVVACAIAILAAPPVFPRAAMAAGAALPRHEIVFRMIAGAAVVLIVTGVAANIGPLWSGLVSAFPTLGTVLAVFSHRANGSAYTAALLRALCIGMASLVAFFIALALLLPRLGVAGGFIVSLVICLVVQGLAAGAMRRARA
jgi:uncharacterized membrane protein (GlpM family)